MLVSRHWTCWPRPSAAHPGAKWRQLGWSIVLASVLLTVCSCCREEAPSSNVLDRSSISYCGVVQQPRVQRWISCSKGVAILDSLFHANVGYVNLCHLVSIELSDTVLGACVILAVIHPGQVLPPQLHGFFTKGFKRYGVAKDTDSTAEY